MRLQETASPGIRASDPTGSRFGGLGPVRAAVLLALLAGHLLFSVFAVVPGHLVSDEGIYHQMAKAFADERSHVLGNGHAEYPSPELRTWNHQIRADGRLISQYPYLHPVLAWPFYEIAGFRGLFALNAVAYIALAGFTFLLSQRLWRDPRIAADALIILTLATFAWQYSQAAWSQLVAATFFVAGIYFAVGAVQSTERRQAIVLAWAAGTAIGFGAGVRLDVIFAAPALLVPLLFDRPPRWREALGVAAGLAPGLVLLSATNQAKFGSFNPLTYGRDAGAASLSGYTMMVVTALVVMGVAWVATRDRAWTMLVRNRWAALAAVFLLAAAAIGFSPKIQHGLISTVWGSWVLIADLSLNPEHVGGIAMTRGPMGSIIYAGMIKKALIQSLPWLPVALLPLAVAMRARDKPMSHLVVLLAVAAFLAIYGRYAWHGGYAFNLRYFVPLLPLFAIYAAAGIHRLAAGESSAALRGAAAAVAFFGTLVWLYMVYRDTALTAMEPVILRMPLILAALLALLLVIAAVRRGAPLLRRLAFLAVFACLAWSFAMALGLDFPRTYMVRMFRFDTGQFLAAHVPADSVLFSVYDPGSFVLAETPGARNAWVNMDDYRDFRGILQLNLAAGRPAFAYFSEGDWADMHERGLLAGIGSVEIAQHDDETLYRLLPAAPSAGNAANASTAPGNPDSRHVP
jgi:hypothetical protein